GSAFGQSNASIAGRITDQQGASVTGAEVRLRSRSSSAQSLTISDDNGGYSLRNIAAGDYALEVTAHGFAAFTSDIVKISRGQSLNQDVKLSVQAVSESVVITASGT